MMREDLTSLRQITSMMIRLRQPAINKTSKTHKPNFSPQHSTFSLKTLKIFQDRSKAKWTMRSKFFNIESPKVLGRVILTGRFSKV